MTNSSKAYTHPDRVLDDTHSLLQLSDGDPHVVCSGLIFVPVVDAADVTLDMIHSLYATSGCTFVTMYFQTLNKHQQKWGMYEIETFAYVVCHRKSHKSVNELMAKFTCIPVKDSGGDVSGGSAVSKLEHASDNTTALGTIPNFNIPDRKIDHLTAKFQRFVVGARSLQSLSTGQSAT